MAHVPGFDNDVFISYAHGDDRDWIMAFFDRLKSRLLQLLPGAETWIDEYDLRRDRNYAHDIPQNLESSAVLVSLVSPMYVTRHYCVQEECRRFSEIVKARKQPELRFEGPKFEADLFGFRCPILPLPDKTYFDNILPGATDIPFCGEDDVQSFPLESKEFDGRFSELVRGLRLLLTRMRNASTPVLVYPRNPAPELVDAHSNLTRELAAQSYRVLPENEFDPVPRVKDCELAVLLLGQRYDETSGRLVEELTTYQKPLVIWPSPLVDAKGELAQIGFLDKLEKLEFRKKTLLDPLITAEKLKEEVLALLNPRAKIPPAPEDKPKVYLIYDARQSMERRLAGRIAHHYGKEFHFLDGEQPQSPTTYLTQSDGVLLMWGNSTDEWWAKFNRMFSLARQARGQGLCLLDPIDSKPDMAREIREKYSRIHVADQFGGFDPSRLEPFFDSLRSPKGEAA